MTLRTAIIFTLLITQYGCHQFGAMLQGHEPFEKGPIRQPADSQPADSQRASTAEIDEHGTFTSNDVEESQGVTPASIRMQIDDNTLATQLSFDYETNPTDQLHAVVGQAVQEALLQFEETNSPNASQSEAVTPAQYHEYFPSGSSHVAPQYNYQQPQTIYQAPMQSQAKLQGEGISQPTPRTATERAEELKSENSQLSKELEQRNEEVKSLQAELTRARQTIITANQVINMTVTKIKTVQQSLADRNLQIEQMHQIIREHEANTTARLQRLTGALRRSLEENEGRSRRTTVRTPEPPILPESIEAGGNNRIEQRPPAPGHEIPDSDSQEQLEMPLAEPLLLSPSTARFQFLPTR